MTVIMSHAVARQRYAAGYAREYAPRLARFAWPLIINGLLIFIGGQGDRIFISNQLGVADLGHYSAVILLIFYPSGMLKIGRAPSELQSLMRTSYAFFSFTTKK